MFMYLLAPFILQNLAPFILIQNYESVPFWGSKWPNCYYFHLPIGPFHFILFYLFFFWGGGYYHSHLPIGHDRSRVMRLCHFWVQNDPLALITFSEYILISLVPLIHVYLHVYLSKFFSSMQFSQNVNEPWELSFYTNSRQN